jgi:hypothetical protein
MHFRVKGLTHGHGHGHSVIVSLKRNLRAAVLHEAFSESCHSPGPVDRALKLSAAPKHEKQQHIVLCVLCVYTCYNLPDGCREPVPLKKGSGDYSDGYPTNPTLFPTLLYWHRKFNIMIRLHFY